MTGKSTPPSSQLLETAQAELAQFEKWFAEPLQQVRKAAAGQSFFIELLTACVLYERLVTARLASRKQKANEGAVVEQLAHDFNLEPHVAQMFWQVVRHGLAHQAMPRRRGRNESFPGCYLHDSFPDRTPIRMGCAEGVEYLSIQPSVFADAVISLWRQEPHLLAHSVAFPWPDVNRAPKT